jgi:hypothetical protein
MPLLLLLLLLCSHLLEIQLRLQLPSHLLIPPHLLSSFSVNKATST